MSATDAQAEYEARLTGFATLIHGNNPPGLAAKLAIFSELLRQQRNYGEELWHIEPLLLPLMHSVEVDLHLSMARLLEPPKRSERSLFKFLTFCEGNLSKISWKNGQPTNALISQQRAALEAHRATIDAILGRRDRFFAHLDKEYFAKPTAIYSDYPLDEDEVIDLANAMIGIVAEHEGGLQASWTINVAELYTISVDNMVRNLRTGRQINFPDQAKDF